MGRGAFAEWTEAHNGIGQPDAAMTVFAQASKCRRDIVQRIHQFKGRCTARLPKNTGRGARQQAPGTIEVQAVDSHFRQAVGATHQLPAIVDQFV